MKLNVVLLPEENGRNFLMHRCKPNPYVQIEMRRPSDMPCESEQPVPATPSYPNKVKLARAKKKKKKKLNFVMNR